MGPRRLAGPFCMHKSLVNSKLKLYLLFNNNYSRVVIALSKTIKKGIKLCRYYLGHLQQG